MNAASARVRRRVVGRLARPLDEARALSMLRAGRPPLAVARALRVEAWRVDDLADRHGVPRSAHHAFSPADEARALAMARDGLSLKRIAEELCVSTTCVHDLLRILGEETAGAARRTAAKGGSPSYRCARCGRTFRVPDRFEARGARPYVLLGGAPWCERCAAERYPRRPPNPDCALGAEFVESRLHCKTGAVPLNH